MVALLLLCLGRVGDWGVGLRRCQPEIRPTQRAYMPERARLAATSPHVHGVMRPPLIFYFILYVPHPSAVVAQVNGLQYHNAMGAHGLAWVALLDARSRVRDLWEDYSRQSRFNPGVEDAHRAWLRACRHASECHITLLRSRPSAAHHTPGLARHRRPQRRRRAH